VAIYQRRKYRRANLTAKIKAFEKAFEKYAAERVLMIDEEKIKQVSK
jgi:hypothetical protein